MTFLELTDLEKKYNEILTSTSRGFAFGHEFLDMWVPGISKEESIKNFFESVKLYNVEKEFGLKIYKKNIKEKDLNKIISLPENYKLTINDEIIEINI